MPFVIPPVAGGGAGAAGGVAPAGIPVGGSPGTPPPSSPASSPPSGEYSYTPPGTTGGSGGSSPGAAPPSSSTPSGNPVPILAPLVPVVPIGGAGAAGGGAAAPGVAPPVGGTPRLPNASEEESDTERDSRDNLPTQCIPWVVQKGQTIHSLAASVGTTPDVIFKINKTTSIVPGQTIRLPAPILIPCCE
ncbi:MAG: LysM peptidoglycan-binding domain-containing protein [Verrucomicrobiota bacterium]